MSYSALGGIKSKISGVWGQAENIYGLESLESTRGHPLPPKDFHSLIKGVKQQQLSELRKKSILRYDKSPEQVYGSSYKSPFKMSIADKVFETKLKRHVIKGKAEQLQVSISKYQED